MALTDNKIASSDYTGRDITTLPVKPTITAAQLQARFDSIVKEVVAVKMNALIDALVAATGAAEIGATVSGMSGDNVSELLTELYATKAPLASPEFTGVPTAPSATAATDNAQVATTAFVHDAIDAAVFTTGAADMAKATYDTTNKATDVFTYFTAPKYTATLDADDWTLNGTVYEQTLTVSGLATTGFTYIAAPATADRAEYYSCGVEPSDIASADTITFTAVNEPTGDIGIVILGIRSA